MGEPMNREKSFKYTCNQLSDMEKMSSAARSVFPNHSPGHRGKYVSQGHILYPGVTEPGNDTLCYNFPHLVQRQRLSGRLISRGINHMGEKQVVTSRKTHILVIDDEKDIREPLGVYLGKHGYRVSLAATGKAMDQILATAQIELIVLDIMLPGEDGLSICRRLQTQTRIPIILLTALTQDTDRIVGLELGADDYMIKPFNPRELLARIKSVLRRSQMLPPQLHPSTGLVKFDQWRFDVSLREISGPDNVAIRLSSGEHLLLVSFIEHAGMTLSRDQLLDLTRGRESQIFDRSIDNQISRLRRKLEKDPKHPRIIITEWGGGYVFAAEIEWAS